MLTTLATCIWHLAVTFPSFIYHGFLNNYYRSITLAFNEEHLYMKNVVVFVHGRGGHHADFNPMINHIRNQSLLPSYHLRTVYLGDTHYTTIDQDVETLRKHMEHYHDCSITLVGLSKGGSAVTKYAPTNPCVRKVITISSPLRGTKLAWWIFWLHQNLSCSSNLGSSYHSN